MEEQQATLIIICGQCDQKMKVPAEASGKTVKCVKCGSAVTVGNTEVKPSQKVAGDTPIPSADTLIGDKLIKAGLITREHLEDALQVQMDQGGKLIEILIKEGHLLKEGLHDFLSRQPGIAAIDLTRFSISRTLISIIPREMAIEHMVLPVDKLGKLLTVAMACPLDTASIRMLEELTGLRVKAMLCKFDDIHAAVKKYYPIESRNDSKKLYELSDKKHIARKDITEKVDTLEQLYISPAATERLRSGVEDVTAAPKTLVNACAFEPGLLLNILRLSNKSLYGMPRSVDSVVMAVTVLGRDGLASLLEMEMLPETDGVSFYRDFASRGRRCARAAAALARTQTGVNPWVAYTVGFLHEIGRYAMVGIAQDTYMKIEKHLHGMQLMEAELQYFTQDHTKIGERLAKSWGLPVSICQAIGHHLEPERAGDSKLLANILMVASYGTLEAGTLTPEHLTPCEEALQAIGLAQDAVVKIIGESLR